MKSAKRNYWKAEEEELLKQWGDKAQCYQWMHARSRKIYQCKNAGFTIPVIIISTLTGTANFAQDRFPEKYREYVVMSIGAMSIIAGIITTIQQFLKISEIIKNNSIGKITNMESTFKIRVYKLRKIFGFVFRDSGIEFSLTRGMFDVLNPLLAR